MPRGRPEHLSPDSPSPARYNIDKGRSAVSDSEGNSKGRSAVAESEGVARGEVRFRDIVRTGCRAEEHTVGIAEGREA